MAVTPRLPQGYSKIRQKVTSRSPYNIYKTESLDCLYFDKLMVIYHQSGVVSRVIFVSVRGSLYLIIKSSRSCVTNWINSKTASKPCFPLSKKSPFTIIIGLRTLLIDWFMCSGTHTHTLCSYKWHQLVFCSQKKNQTSCTLPFPSFTRISFWSRPRAYNTTVFLRAILQYALSATHINSIVINLFYVFMSRICRASGWSDASVMKAHRPQRRTSSAHKIEYAEKCSRTSERCATSANRKKNST